MKVFLRTYNDAIECAASIAKWENAKDHYKSYIKTLISSIKEDKVRVYLWLLRVDDDRWKE